MAFHRNNEAQIGSVSTLIESLLTKGWQANSGACDNAALGMSASKVTYGRSHGHETKGL